MNSIGINITADLSELIPYGVNQYLLQVNFLNNSTGNPLGDSRIPNTYTQVVYTTTPSFQIAVPIEDGTFSIPNVRIEVIGNNDPDCCKGTLVTTIVNTENCQFVINVDFAQCNGIMGIAMNNGEDPLAEPLVISVKLQGDPAERFFSRSGSLIAFTKANLTNGTYTTLVTDANGCTSSRTFVLSCPIPTFNFEYLTNVSCSGSDLINGTARIYNPTDATRYKICYGSTIFNCGGDCTTSDGLINPSGDTIIPLIAPAAGTYRTDTIRVYNGPYCQLYVDYNMEVFSPVCGVSCPPDGSWSQNLDGTWYKMTTTSPTTTPSGYDIISKKSQFYAIDGSLIYAIGLGSTTLLTSIPLWKANTATNGPMNRCSVWTNQTDIEFPPNDLPMGMWLGFSHCLTGLTPGKTYYVGLEADNQFRVVVDGEIIYENLSNTTHFRTWKIVPVVAKKADMLISMEAANIDRVAGFGCEVYDNTSSQIIAATVIGDLNIIFSSASKVGGKFHTGGLSGGIQYGYGCPSGYTYNPCSGLCQKIDYCN